VLELICVTLLSVPDELDGQTVFFLISRIPRLNKPIDLTFKQLYTEITKISGAILRQINIMAWIYFYEIIRR